MRNCDKQNSKESKEIIAGVKVMTEARTGLERGNFPEAITIEIEIQAIVGPGQHQEPVQIETE